MITNPNEMNIEYRQDSYKKEKVFQNTIEEVSDNEKFSLKDRFRHLKDLGDQNEFTFMNIARQVSASSLYSHNVQVCRSAGNWSLGLKSSKPENSIQIAYLELIEKSRKFIYIENQFFISSTAGEPLKNKIAEALLLRIRRAIEKGETFMVFIVIPLLPGFEGSVEEPKGTFTRITLGFQQLTISKGPKAILAE